jgi:hypothetical protein
LTAAATVGGAAGEIVVVMGAGEGAGTMAETAFSLSLEDVNQVGFGDASLAEPIWARASWAAPVASLPRRRCPFALRTAAPVTHRMTIATERTRRAGAPPDETVRPSAPSRPGSRRRTGGIEPARRSTWH